MNLKSKLFGFAAASALALSMTTGVMAQSTGSTGAEVELTAGVCSMSVMTSNVEFENLTWDGYAWSNDAADEWIGGVVKNGKPGQECEVQARSGGLAIRTGDRNSMIPLIAEGTPLTLAYQTVKTMPTGNLDLRIELGDAGDNYPAGTYEGTIQFQMPTGA